MKRERPIELEPASLVYPTKRRRFRIKTALGQIGRQAEGLPSTVSSPFLLITNIPSSLTLSDLREHFYDYIEQSRFANFHYLFRPSTPAVASSTTSWPVELGSTDDATSFIRHFHGQSPFKHGTPHIHYLHIFQAPALVLDYHFGSD